MAHCGSIVFAVDSIVRECVFVYRNNIALIIGKYPMGGKKKKKNWKVTMGYERYVSFFVSF